MDVATCGGVGQAAVGKGVFQGFEEAVDGGLFWLRGGSPVGAVLARRFVGVGGQEADGLGHA